MAATEPSSPPPGPDGGRRPATEAEARALGSALRLRILRLCLGEAHTNKEIAERLGRDPASVLHHVRRLVDTGFLQALPARRGTRGSREVPYQATGKSWTLSVADHSRRATDALLQAFLDELEDAGGELVEATRLGLRLRPEDREELNRRMSQLLNEFADREPDPDGEWWSVFYAMHADARGERH